MRSVVGLLLAGILPAEAAGQLPPKGATVNVAPAAAGEFHGKPVKKWLAEIASPDPGVRQTAITAVPWLGAVAAADAVTPLLAEVKKVGNDHSPQTNAIIVLGQIAIPEVRKAEVADALAAILRSNGQTITRYQAAMTLATLGPAGRSAVPALAAKLNDLGSFEIRRAVALALGSIGIDTSGLAIDRAFEALIEHLNTEQSKQVKLECLYSIISLGPPAQGYNERLKDLLRRRLKQDGRDAEIEIWVRVTMMRIDPAEINEVNFKAIAAHLRDADPAVAGQAAKALGFVGPGAKGRLPDLRDALTHTDVTVLLNAAWAIGRMGIDGRPAVPDLRRLLERSTDKSVKDAVASALTAIETPPPVAKP